MSDDDDAPVGIDVAIVDPWLRSAVPGLEGTLRWTAIVGGHSNLTYRVQGDHRAVIVRRPPLGRLPQGAHDMVREHRIIEGVWGTDVPVPEPLALCDDAAVSDHPFFVMSLVDGRPLDGRQATDAFLPVAARQRAADTYIDALAALHRLDPDAIGLGTLSRRDDYVGRQLRAWYRAWCASSEEVGLDDPRVHSVHDHLQATKPADTDVRVVHGDYGMHNCLFAADGQLAAVLDWEVCTLGAPLADLAYVLNRWPTPDAPIAGRDGMVSMLPGFPPAARLVERYATATGADVGGLPYFVALNNWRSACIAHGVYSRYVRAGRELHGLDIERFRATVDSRLAQAEEAIRSR